MKHKIIEEIKKEFFLLDLLQAEATFECYSDGIFTYHVEDDRGGFHELCIINKRASFFAKEKVCDLIELDNMFYLSCRYFKEVVTDLGIINESSNEKTFRLVDTEGYTDEDWN